MRPRVPEAPIPDNQLAKSQDRRYSRSKKLSIKSKKPCANSTIIQIRWHVPCKVKKNQLIGLIFPTVANPFYGELINLLEEKLFNMEYKTILCNSASDREKEKNYLSMLSANKANGIIAGAHNLEIDEYQKLNMPIISFDRSLADTIPIVSSDNYRGGAILRQNISTNKGPDKSVS
ncbi:hypothetical protein [Aerococcus vaginalis]